MLCKKTPFQASSKADFEDNLTNGFGGEIASKIIENAFEYLDAPIKRVASKDFPVPYASELENEILVQTSWIKSAIKEL